MNVCIVIREQDTRQIFFDRTPACCPVLINIYIDFFFNFNFILQLLTTLT